MYTYDGVGTGVKVNSDVTVLALGTGRVEGDGEGKLARVDGVTTGGVTVADVLVVLDELEIVAVPASNAWYHAGTVPFALAGVASFSTAGTGTVREAEARIAFISAKGMMAPETEVMTAAKAGKDRDPRILSSLPQLKDVQTG